MLGPHSDAFADESGMSVSSVIGVLWGDEGKGKVIDYLAAVADVVVR